MKNSVEIEQTVERNKPAPARGQAVLVQCSYFRCMAYRAADGKWRNYFSHDELGGNVTEVKTI